MTEIDPVELARWQGAVDEHLLNVDGRLGNLEIDVKQLPDQIEKRVEKVINGHTKGIIDFRWMLEKVAIPLVVAGGSAGAAIYAVVKTISSGSPCP